MKNKCIYITNIKFSCITLHKNKIIYFITLYKINNLMTFTIWQHIINSYYDTI
jgi:hypothetical protein